MDRRPLEAKVYVDARPVTAVEFARFEGDAGPGGDETMTHVSLEQAQAYARWAGKRLPTDAEWTAIVDALGPDKLGVGCLWEWTASPADARGHIVRGGRWRDIPEPAPSPLNRSFETGPCPDLGFRCVCDRDRDQR